MHEGRFTRIAGLLLVALLFGACGSDDRKSELVIPPGSLAPAILSFDAGPRTITAGDSVALGWRTQNAESLALVDETGATIPIDHLPIELGSVSVAPTETTSYTLTATGRDGPPAWRTVTITVREEPSAAPAVEKFTATPEVVAVGSRVTLSWKTTGANSVTIKDDAGVEVDLGNAIAEGQVSVKPTRSPTVYALTASGPGGRATAQASVTVTGPPRIVRFDVSPTEPIDVGGEVTLTWETSNATRVVIEKDGQPLVDSTTRLSGSETVELSDSAVFTIDATSATGAATARAEAKVGPRILVFSSTERSVRSGDTVTFTWELDGAGRATVDGPGGCHLEIDGAENASGSDTCVVTLPGDYVLRAYRGGVSRIATIPIDVTTAPRIHDLAVDPPLVTAAADRQAEVKLSWRQSGAARCTIYVNGQSAAGQAGFPCGSEGSADLMVTGTSSIRFEAINDDGRHDSTVSVNAVEPARIVSFAAIPDRLLDPGDPVTLKWNVTGAVSVSMEKNDVTFEIDGDAFVVDDRAVHAPDLVGFDSYRLTAVNSLNDATHATVAVRVGAPEILGVQVDPNVVAMGEPFVVGWLVDGGTTLAVTGPGGGGEQFRTDDPVRIDSGFSDTLYAPTVTGVYEYTVTATNSVGSSSAVVGLTATDGPIILSFTVDRSEISLGEPVTFSWRVKDNPFGDNTVLSLRDDYGKNYTEINGKDPNHGSATITPAADKPYVFTLTASTGGGRLPAEASLPIDVTVAPVIVSFTASAERVVTEGGSVTPEVTLAWRSRNAIELMLWDLDDAGDPRGSTPFHSVSLANGDDQGDLDEGSFIVHPTITTRYLARVRNRVNTVVEREVRVVADPPEVLSFEAARADIAEGETTELVWTTRHATSVTIDPLLPYVDISNQPFATKSSFTSGDSVVTIEFPESFSFPFEGENKTSIKASSNGLLGFGAVNGSGEYSSALPNTNRARVNFYVYGCDLTNTKGSPAGEFWSGLTADIFGPMFVMQYKNWSWMSDAYNPSSLNFELVLRPSGGFEFRYGEMTAKAGYEDQANGKECLIGYQGTEVTQPWEHFVPFQQPLAGGLANKSFVRPSLPAHAVNDTLALIPPRTLTYTLTAINDDAETTAQTTVTVWKRPTVTARVTPAGAEANRPIQISWTTTNANGLRVLDADHQPICVVTETEKVAAGSCTRTEPTAGLKTYTVEVVNGPPGAPVATTTTSLGTTVYENLAITSFTVDEFAKSGDRVTVSWSTAGASGIEVFACPRGTVDPWTCPGVAPPNAVPEAGSFALEATKTVEFWLVAYDTSSRAVVSGGQTLWVDAGTLDWFRASNTQILAGESTTLSWSSTDQDTAILSPRQGAFEVTPIAPYEDISQAGTTVGFTSGTSADSNFYTVTSFPNGFTFPWFGERKTALRAATDGWITFNTSYGSFHSAEGALPSTSHLAVQLAPFWDNLVQNTGGFRYHIFEPPGSERYMVFQWDGFRFQPTNASSSILNFQVVLFESGTVDFRYDVMSVETTNQTLKEYPNGYSAAVGWQNPTGTLGEELVRYTAGVVMQGGLAGRSWRFPIQLSPSGSLTVSPTESTTYKMCATNKTSGHEDCKEVRVLVIQPGDVVFSELMIAPASEEAEWLEIRNMSPDAIDLRGWVLASGSDEYTIPSPLVVPSYGYAVFARSSEPTINGGLVDPHVYSDAIVLDTTADDVRLSLRTMEIDKVTWDNTWPIEADTSIVVNPTSIWRSTTCNDNPTAWCASTSRYGDETFGGSPGADGPVCP